MEVTYKTTISNDKDWQGNSKTSYKFKVISPNIHIHLSKITGCCCDDMIEAWNDKDVVLEEFPGGDVLPEVKLRFGKSDYDGGTFYECQGISFCPWCGQRITVKEVERVRLVSKLVQVTKIQTVTEYEEIPEEVRKSEDWEKE